MNKDKQDPRSDIEIVGEGYAQPTNSSRVAVQDIDYYSFLASSDDMSKVTINCQETA